MNGLENTVYEKHTAVDVATDGYVSDAGTRPYKWEQAQADYLVRVGDGAAVLYCRDTWQLRIDKGFTQICFFSNTPYEANRYINWSNPQPTKNEDAYEFRYTAVAAPDGFIRHDELVLIVEQIIASDGTVFYEQTNRIVEKSEQAGILGLLNSMRYPYYMYMPNLTQVTDKQALWYQNQISRWLMTPAEVADETGTAASTWRNKAADGKVPGALKKGKQWLLPRSVLRGMGVDV